MRLERASRPARLLDTTRLIYQRAFVALEISIGILLLVSELSTPYTKALSLAFQL